MSFNCLICNKQFYNNKGLSSHIRVHRINIHEYNKRFNLLCYCPKCGKEINCFNKSGCCNSCRNRTKENNPFYKQKHTNKTKEILRQKCSISSINLWKDDNYRNKVIKNSSKPRSNKFAKEQSERVKKWYKNNPEQKEIRSQYMKNYWEEGIIVKNNYSCNSSKLEKELFKSLKEINPNFREKETLNIDKKWFFPDIIDLNKKIIIEFFGDFWHCNPNQYNENDDFNFGLKVKDVWAHDKERINKFIDLGYKVVIVWESDYLNNKKDIICKIQTLV